MKRKRSQEAMDMIDAAIKSGRRLECIFWPYWRDKDGYARAPDGPSSFAVHRRSCEVMHGKAPDGKPYALHSCGNGHLGCINPYHLRWGTQLENIADMDREGRRARGTQCGGVLSVEQVLEIRSLRGKLTHREIARRLGVAKTTVANAQRFQTYTHL